MLAAGLLILPLPLLLLVILLLSCFGSAALRGPIRSDGAGG
jgi:hypothetical protein